MATLDTEEQKISTELSEEELQREKVNKLFKTAKISILVALTILWIVSAVLGLISVWNGEGILDTPWIILGLVLMIFIVIFVIIPLFRSLRNDVKEFNKEKAKNVQLEIKQKENKAN